MGKSKTKMMDEATETVDDMDDDQAETERRKPHFFKILLGDFHQRLRIPPMFLKHISDEPSDKVTLYDPHGKSWTVDLEKTTDGTFLSSGWASVVNDCGLKENEFLVFCYEGDMQFTVLLFDKTACQKEIVQQSETEKYSILSEVRGEQEGHKTHGMDPDLLSKSHIMRKSHYQEEKTMLAETADHSNLSEGNDKQEQFMNHSQDANLLLYNGEILRESACHEAEMFTKTDDNSKLAQERRVQNIFVNHQQTKRQLAHENDIDMKITETADNSGHSERNRMQEELISVPIEAGILPPKRESWRTSAEHDNFVMVTETDDTSKLFQVQVQQQTLAHSIDPDLLITNSGTSGNSDYKKKIAMLTEKDSCSKLSEGRGKPKRLVNKSVGADMLPSKGESESKSVQTEGNCMPVQNVYIKSQSKHDIKNAVEEAATRRTSCSKGKHDSHLIVDAERAAISFRSKFPYFVRRMTACNVSNSHTLRTPAEFARTHLPNRKSNLILRDPTGKAWILVYIPGTTGMFSGGWTAFARGNDLKFGDICAFEKVGPVELCVTIFRAKSKTRAQTEKQFVHLPACTTANGSVTHFDE